jgi:hypothetical protein
MHPNALPNRLRAASTDPLVQHAAAVIEELYASGDIPLHEVLRSIAQHAIAACALLYPVDAEQPTGRIWKARCRHCSASILRRDGQDWWQDDRGLVRCMKLPISEIGANHPSVPGHEPMPAGLAGAPTEAHP